jgi:sulfate transport system substrate-binding protein
VKKGIVRSNWNKNRYHGMVTDSVVVFVVRNGNPKNIRTWGDLTKSGVQVITPNPFTSGGARWNVMAAYGAERAQGKTDKQAIAYLKKLFKNVPVLPKSARDATQVFAQGKGDVLLTYENEAIYANKKGVHTEYVVPKQTILIENPVAVTRGSQHPEQAHAFVDFLHSPQAQHLFGTKGYRPVVPQVLSEFKYVTPPHLFTIAKLGGWSAVNTKFFDSDASIMATIEQGQGAFHAAH